MESGTLIKLKGSFIVDPDEELYCTVGHFPLEQMIASRKFPHGQIAIYVDALGPLDLWGKHTKSLILVENFLGWIYDDECVEV